MNNAASQFVGDIPINYDNGLGPNIFHDYAEDLARRAGASGAGSVLELAAGPVSSAESFVMRWRQKPG